MPQQVLALALDAGELKAALVETSFRDYRVVAFHQRKMPVSDGPVAEQLRQFITDHQIEATTVLSSLPGDLVTWRTLKLPFRDGKRLDQTVPFELESQVPFGLDDAVVDYHVLQRDRSGSTVLAALVRRHDLEAHLHLLSEAGLDPKIVDLVPLATLNTLQLLGSALPSSFVFLGGSAERTIVAVYRDGHLLGLRSLLPRPSSAAAFSPLSSAADAGAAAASGEGTKSAELAAEVRWTVLAMNGGPPEVGLPCLFAAEAPGFESIAENLRSTLGVAPQRLEEMPLAHVPPALHGEVPGHAAALGLALREVAPNQSVGVNFRRGEFAYHRGEEETRRALWRTGALAAAVLAVLTLSMYMRYNNLNDRSSVLQQQIREVFTQTLPEVVSVVEPRMQLQSEIDAEQRKLELLGGMAPLGGATAIDSMRVIASALPATMKLDVDQYLMDPESIRIKASTDSFESADSIKRRIDQTGYFGDVQVKDVKASADGASVSFRLTLFFSKDGAGGAVLR
jgi:general secretion pathway protein L